MAQELMFSGPTTNLLESLGKGDQGAASAALAARANVNEQGRRGITPLIYAVIKQSEAAVTGLLKLNADPNVRQQDGHNALTAAYELSRSAPAIFGALIISGKCDLNALMPDGEPMLYYLAASGKLDFLRLALKHGANPSLRTRGNRLLVIAAAIIEAYDPVQMLLDAGASPDATDPAGKTLLQIVRNGSAQEIDPQGTVNQARLRLQERLLKPLAK